MPEGGEQKAFEALVVCAASPAGRAEGGVDGGQVLDFEAGEGAEGEVEDAYVGPAQERPGVLWGDGEV